MFAPRRQRAETVVDALEKPRDLISLVEDRPGHVLSHAVDSEKLMKTTGWRPARLFDKAVPEVVEWYARHADWWRPTILGEARGYFEERYPDLVRTVEGI